MANVLMPKQVKKIIDEVVAKREAMESYKEEIQREHLKFDSSYISIYNQDNITAYQAMKNIQDLEDLENLLVNSEFYISESEKVEVGKTVEVQFDGEEETESLQVVSNIVGLNSTIGFISVNSDFGKSIIGKQAGESFNYSLSNGNKLSGTIISIEGEKNHHEEPQQITSKIKKARASYSERNRLSVIYSRRDLSEITKEEYLNSKAITNSQVELLKDELETMLEKHNNRKVTANDKDIGRYTAIYKALKNRVAQAPNDGKIGIGSSFSVLIEDGDNLSVRNFEMINSAVSTETDDKYIERISSLGSKLYGKRDYESITIKTDDSEVKYTVFNVNKKNNFQKSFQKRK